MRPLVLAAVGLLAALSGCASTDPVWNAVSVGVYLKGSEPFCIYGPAWSINGWAPRGAAAAYDREVCTEPKARQDGTYRQTAPSAGVIGGNVQHYKRFTVTFRRSQAGPPLMAEFDLEGKLTPAPGTTVFSLEPRITNTGVELYRVDIKRGRDLADIQFLPSRIDTKEGN